MGYWDWKPYVSVGEKKAKAIKKLDQLRKKNPKINPISIEGRNIANSWWGKSWNKNLEKYADYSNRIGRGRSYVRHGSVLDLKIKKGAVESLVMGSRSTPYSVKIKITSLNSRSWNSLKKKASSQIESISELLEGSFPKKMGEFFTDVKGGLFPTPKEIQFSCSCPDWASMCKHVAATLYGVGARLDESPELFFTLRNVDMNGLLSSAVKKKKDELLSFAKKKNKSYYSKR